MSPDDKAEEYLEAITAEGKEITINIKIKDPKKAAELLWTMYGKNVDKYGVEVQSWGFWDIKKAQEIRIASMVTEIERHRQAMKDLTGKYDQDLLEERP